MENPCGTCSVCCRVYSIEGYKDTEMTDCPQLQLGVGCRSYDTRPDICKEYKCCWLVMHEQSVADLKYRPDKLKFVMNLKIGGILHCVELMPGARFTKNVQAMLQYWTHLPDVKQLQIRFFDQPGGFDSEYEKDKK